jgi:hypothetical protein
MTPLKYKELAWHPLRRLGGTGHRIFGLEFKGWLLALRLDARLHTFVGEATSAEELSRKLYHHVSTGIHHGRPFSPDGTRMVACAGQKLYMLDAKTGEILTSFDAYPPSPLRFLAPNFYVGATAFSPDGIHVAAGIYGKQLELRIWRP